MVSKFHELNSINVHVDQQFWKKRNLNFSVTSKISSAHIVHYRHFYPTVPNHWQSWVKNIKPGGCESIIVSIRALSNKSCTETPHTNSRGVYHSTVQDCQQRNTRHLKNDGFSNLTRLHSLSKPTILCILEQRPQKSFAITDHNCLMITPKHTTNILYGLSYRRVVCTVEVSRTREIRSDVRSLHIGLPISYPQLLQ